MKKGQIYTGTVEKTEFPNKGVIYIDGEKVIVKHALLGQEVRFVVNKKRNGKCEGRLLEVQKSSPLETEPNRCPHFGICGGCLMQSISYQEQLHIKEQQIRSLMKPIWEVDAGKNILFEGIKPSPVWEGYRNKMEFSFGDQEKGGPLSLGMHKKGSFHDVVNADNCKIVHSDFTKILKSTREYFSQSLVPFYKKLKHEGYLRHLLVRRASRTGEILVALVTTKQTNCLEKDEKQLLEDWKNGLLQLSLEGAFAGILHIYNDSLADVVQSDKTDILYGQDYFYEELSGLRFKISPFSFFQTNSLGAEILYDTVKQYAGDIGGKVVFDLYSGTGTIAQMLASGVKKAVGVEIVEEAVKAARENAAMNKLDNCEFIAGDVLNVVNELKEKPDLIILDPPREGLHPKALQKIIGFGVKQMVYISCKPTSLVRDLEILMSNGYQIKQMCCVDMFPSTANIETICLLSKLP